MAYATYIKGLAGRLATRASPNPTAVPMKSPLALPARAPGARSRRALIAIGLLELGYEAAPLNRNFCCYCGGGLDSSFGSGLVIGGSRAEVQAALRLAEQQAREPAIPQGRA